MAHRTQRSVLPTALGYQRRGKESQREVTQSCPTLCDPMDCSFWGSSIHGIFQAGVLGWVAVSFSILPAALGHQCIIKSYHSGTMGEKLEQAWGGVGGFQVHPAPPSQHLLWSPTRISLDPILLGFCGGFITQGRLIKSLAIGNWTPSPTPLPSAEVELGAWGLDWEFWPSQHRIGFPGN